MRHSNTTTIKIDENVFPCFVAISDAGGMAFAWTDKMLNQEEEGCGNLFANKTTVLLNKITEQFEDTGKIELNENEYLLVLSTIRGALEAFICFDSQEIGDMLSYYNPSLKAMIEGAENTIDAQDIATEANIILDFLECHAPPMVMSKWLSKRREASVTRLQHLSDKLGRES